MSRATAIFLMSCLPVAPLAVAEAGGDAALKAPADFQHIGDEQQRARAMFEELGRVIQHPRCVNCHPRTDRPMQGESGALHQPLVMRGLGGMGRPGMMCNTCHLAENARNVPGNSKWLLAPASMVWEDVSL